MQSAKFCQKKRNLSKTKTKTKMDMNGLRDWIISLSIIHAKRNKSKQEEKEREQIERKKNNMKWITFRPKSFKNKEGMFIELQLSQQKFFHKVSLFIKKIGYFRFFIQRITNYSGGLLYPGHLTNRCKFHRRWYVPSKNTWPSTWLFLLIRLG